MGFRDSRYLFPMVLKLQMWLVKQFFSADFLSCIHVVYVGMVSMFMFICEDYPCQIQLEIHSSLIITPNMLIGYQHAQDWAVGSPLSQSGTLASGSPSESVWDACQWVHL